MGAARAHGRKGWATAFRDATLFKVCYGWGLRRREAAMLDLADFGRNPAGPQFGEFGACYVRYGKALKGSPPRRRTVLDGAGDWTVEALHEYLREIRPLFDVGARQLLWPTERGARIAPRDITRRFAAYRDELGLDPVLHPHCLRHSYITHLIEDGADPLFVQFLLSPPEGVHDVQHEARRCRDLRGGDGYLPPSITRMIRRSDACAAGADARLVA